MFGITEKHKDNFIIISNNIVPWAPYQCILPTIKILVLLIVLNTWDGILMELNNLRVEMDIRCHLVHYVYVFTYIILHCYKGMYWTYFSPPAFSRFAHDIYDNFGLPTTHSNAKMQMKAYKVYLLFHQCLSFGNKSSCLYVIFPAHWQRKYLFCLIYYILNTLWYYIRLYVNILNSMISIP